jgi:hypothetical protein
VEVDEAMALFAALERERVAYVLVGAVALALQGEIRATQDIDLFVSSDPENVARLRAALSAVFADPDIEQITSEDLAGEFDVVRYVPPSGDYAVDLIARLGTAVAFADLRWEVVVRDGVSIRVATPGTLYAMKRDTVRPQDRLDAARLRERFGLDAS